jgi:hypothetical protein
MKINEKIAAAITKAKALLTAHKPPRYSHRDVTEAGISRPYKSKQEQKDIEAIRAELKIKKRVADHKKSLGL